MTAATETRAIDITGGIKVVCPADWTLMTPYVLMEQQDWFEDEIRFLREIITPDTVLIDIGANYGLYTLAIAKLSPRGQVWSYEPCSATADCLQKSIAENYFGNVTLIRQALSDNTGSGSLQIGPHAETNMLVDANNAGESDVETVELTTLDTQWKLHRWNRVDLVKIDAEGQEAQVINGGREFFTSSSPLVMCEVKTRDTLDLNIASLLTRLGYAPYRLVPGLAALVPQDLAEPPDSYQLNLFFCKSDRAVQLQRDNRLVTKASESAQAPAVAPDRWQTFLAGFPYGRSGVNGWALNVSRHPGTGWNEYRNVLNLYAQSKDQNLGIAMRYAALRAAFTGLRGFIEKNTTAPRLLSYARMATEFGSRDQAVNALDYFLKISSQLKFEDFLREPLLAPCAEFDTIAPAGNLHEWAHAAALEAFERCRSFSSYFTEPGTTLGLANALEELGYLTPHMKQRAKLARRRIGRANSA